MAQKKILIFIKIILPTRLKKKYLGLIFSYIKEVIHVNFRSYETLIDQLPKLENKYIVFFRLVP